MRNSRLRLLSWVLVLILAAIGAGAVWVIQNTPNKAVANAFDIPETRLVIGGELYVGNCPPLVKDGQILIPFDTVKARIDPYVWYDEALQKITVTTKDRVVRMKTDSLEALVNEKPIDLKIPAVEENGALYLPIEFLSDFYGISVRYAENNDVVIIDFKSQLVRLAYPLSTEAVLRKGMSIREPIVRKFIEEDIQSEEGSLMVFEEYADWYKVRTQDGVLGFIRKADVVIKDMKVTQRMPDSSEAPALPGGKINLVWDMTYSRSDMALSRETAPGIDVISPTWFEIVDRKGTIKSRATPEYTEKAHKNGWQVWALFSNDFGDIDGTSLLLNNTDKRQEIIRGILAYAALYKLDGINLDFENIYKRDKEAYTQFVRELYPLLKEQGLYLSVDVTVPDGSDNWSKCFDRKALAESVDYVCLMAYDQHWSSSPKAGSTAELEWVEKNLKKTLQEVPAYKLLLGVPLYTRLWSEETKNGTTKVQSKALDMANAWKEVRDNEAAVAWNDAAGQFQASYVKDGITYRLWLEDAEAVNMKTSLVHKYGLGGACVWAANFADEKVFQIFERNLKKVAHYQEWKRLYGQPARAE